MNHSQSKYNRRSRRVKASRKLSTLRRKSAMAAGAPEGPAQFWEKLFQALRGLRASEAATSQRLCGLWNQLSEIREILRKGISAKEKVRRIRKVFPEQAFFKSYSFLTSSADIENASKKISQAYIPALEVGGGYWLNGKRVSNFTVKVWVSRRGEFVVRKMRFGGNKTIHHLPTEALVTPAKFREFCLSKGNYTWMGGEKELQLLQTDIARLAGAEEKS